MRFLFQLKVASDCGLKIPTTLCSNETEEIRQFLLQHEEDGVIYKPLNSENEPVNVNSHDFMACDVPGIFQKESLKQYELRVTCFGKYLVATKLKDSSHPQQAIEPHVLPDDLANKIRALMHALRVAFGTCDFVVTPEQDYIFLNVNEQIHYRCSTLNR